MLWEKGIVERLGKGNGDRAAVFSLKKGGVGVLHCAACAGHLKVCKYLVEELGGDANMTAAEGPSLSLSRSANWQFSSMTTFGTLYEPCGLFLFIAGVTPFMTAAQSGDVSTVKYLLDRGGDLMKADEKGRTVLHHAACTGYFSVINALRDYLLNMLLSC